MSKPVYILNLETTTKNCSVSVAKNGDCIARKEMSDEQFIHAEYLHLFIQEVLQESQIRFQDLSAIAVSKGPGSYTGLRIGVSAAKGLCYALDLPLLALDTMQILAQQIKNPLGTIITVLDARRMEVYYAVFDKKYKQLQTTQALVVESDSFYPFLIDANTSFVGDAVEKMKPILTDAPLSLTENSFPSAKEMCGLSFEKFETNDWENLAYFEPFYLKDFIVTSKIN